MSIDTSEFPFVWISFGDAASDDLTGFEDLLSRKQEFVLLQDNSKDAMDPEHEHPHDERKQMTIWMKRNRPELRTYVKAMISIEPNAVKRTAMKGFAVMFGKGWGFPLLMSASKAEAMRKARDLLGQRVE